jgi:hypothetical protein
MAGLRQVYQVCGKQHSLRHHQPCSQYSQVCGLKESGKMIRLQKLVLNRRTSPRLGLQREQAPLLEIC